MSACNCENTRCPHHNEKVADTGDIYKDFKMSPCSNQTDGQHVAFYVGEICDACASHMPTQYMRKVDGRETLAGWRERTRNYSMEQADRVKHRRRAAGQLTMADIEELKKEDSRAYDHVMDHGDDERRNSRGK